MKNYNKHYNQPLYAVFIKQGETLYGYVENSFSMSWTTNYIRVWTKDEIGEALTNKKSLTKWVGRPDCFVARVKSKKCPADIVLQNLTDKTGKYEWRNKMFKAK